MSTEFCFDKIENKIVESVETVKTEEHKTELQTEMETVKTEEHKTELQTEMEKTNTETQSDKVVELNPETPSDKVVKPNPRKEKKKKRNNKIIIGSSYEQNENTMGFKSYKSSTHDKIFDKKYDAKQLNFKSDHGEPYVYFINLNKHKISRPVQAFKTYRCECCSIVFKDDKCVKCGRELNKQPIEFFKTNWRHCGDERMFKHKKIEEIQEEIKRERIRPLICRFYDKKINTSNTFRWFYCEQEIYDYCYQKVNMTRKKLKKEKNSLVCLYENEVILLKPHHTIRLDFEEDKLKFKEEYYLDDAIPYKLISIPSRDMYNYDKEKEAIETILSENKY